MPVLPVYVKHQKQQHVKSSLNLCENHVTDAGENSLMYVLGKKIDIPVMIEKYGRPSPKIQGCQIDQQIQSWSKDQLQDSIANKGIAWPNYRRFSFPSSNRI